jgi:hypothetical protein
MGKACCTDGEEECIEVLVGKPEGKRPLGKPTGRWEDDIVTCYLGNVTNNLWTPV